MTVTLAVLNLLDKKYWRSNAMPGAPRSFRVRTTSFETAPEDACPAARLRRAGTGQWPTRNSETIACK